MERLVNLKIFTNVEDDAKERLLFGIFAFLGAGIIIALRILNDLSFESFVLNFVIALIAVSFIIIYGLINLKTLNLVGNALDRSSDNAYYLGLLYTLFSLTYSLVKIGKNISDDGAITGSFNILSLLPDFGIALLSTIAGIGMRVWMQQYNNDPGTIDNEARQQLGKMLEEIKTSMIRFQGDLSTLSTTYNTTSEELNRRVSETLEEATRIHADNIKTVSQQLVDLAAENKRQIEVIGNSAQTISETLTESAEVLRSSFSQITTNIETNLNNFSNRLDSSSEKISDVVEKIDNAAQQMTTTVNILSDINVKESEMRNGFNQLIKKVNDTIPRIDKADENIDKISNIFEQSREKFEQSIKEIGEEADNIKSSSKAAKDATNRYIKGLNDAADTIKDATEKKL